MKTRYSIILSLLLMSIAALSCVKEETRYSISADRTVIKDVAANNPGKETIVITTDAPYWIVTGPDWIEVDPDTGVGGGGSTVVTITIASNYKNESTDTKPRSGELEFAGGKASVKVTVSQLGHKGYIDPSSAIGGIPDMAEFIDFVSAVNEEASLYRWQNADGEIELQTDLDLSEMTEWVPIGNVSKSGNDNYASNAVGSVFSGVFNGGGHTIRNFKATAVLTAGQSWGLFGYLSHATVKDLNIEADLTLSAKGAADAGVVAGTAYCSTIENVNVNAKITSTGTNTNKRFSIGGIAGFAYSVYDSDEDKSYDSSIKNCTVTVDLNMDWGTNTTTGATGTMFGGMAGYCTNVKDASRVVIEDCVNNGSMKGKIGRCSGIVASATYGTTIKGCTNNASQINNAVNARIGQVVCYLAAESCIIDCVNTGDLTTSEPDTHAAGIVALMGDDSCYMEGGTRVANTGKIVGNYPKYTGLMCANMNKLNHISDVILDGVTGLYKEDGNHVMNPVNKSNFMDYIGYVSDANKAKLTNITYVGEGTDEPTIPTPDPDLDKTAGFRILFIGNSFSKDAVEHLPGILDAAGLDNIQMVHMYYGGRTVPEHYRDWSNVDGYYCFVCNPGQTEWITYRDKTIEKAAYSGKYDVIAFQEHTGKRVAWEWTADEKAAVQGLKDKLLKAQQDLGGTPKIYYILSQAYHNLAKSENNNRPFTTTAQMWDVVSAQGRKAVEECGFDGVISTGAMLQNLRTSGLNNEMGLTRDGYHMDYGIARYGASCTVFETIIGPFNGGVTMDGNSYRTGVESREENGWTTAVTDERAPIALKAARYAIANPYTVTDMHGEGGSSGSDTPVTPDNVTISSAADLVALSARIDGGDKSAMVANVTLASDIDMSGVTDWVPIGNVTSSGNDSYITGAAGHPFSGVFDGGGHTIRNFKATVSLAAGKTWGLFGYLSKATVKNLNIADADLTISATGAADAGVLAGTAYCSTIENVKVGAKITSTGSTASKRFSVGGIVGFAFSDYDSEESKSYDTVIKDCEVTVNLDMDCGSNTAGGAGGVMYGGMAGFCTNAKENNSKIRVTNCVHNGPMNVRVGRCSGIVASAIYGTVMTGCTNNSSQVNSIVNSRIGLVCCYLGVGSCLVDCVNTGDLTTSDSQTHAAALVALMADDSCYIEGGSRVANTGRIVGNYPKFTGLLCANMNKLDHISNVILSGSTGLYKADGNHQMNSVNSTNVMDYIGYIADSLKSKLSNITYVNP